MTAKKATATTNVYRVHAATRSDSPENLYLLQAYVPQADGTVKIGAVLYAGAEEKCRELLDQLNTGELTQEAVKELYAQEQEQPQEPAPEREAAPEPEPVAYTHLDVYKRQGPPCRAGDFAFWGISPNPLIFSERRAAEDVYKRQVPARLLPLIAADLFHG